MKSSDLKKLKENILQGMKISSQKMIEKKKTLGNKIVISENGKIKILNPENL